VAPPLTSTPYSFSLVQYHERCVLPGHAHTQAVLSKSTLSATSEYGSDVVYVHLFEHSAEVQTLWRSTCLVMQTPSAQGQGHVISWGCGVNADDRVEMTSYCDLRHDDEQMIRMRGKKYALLHVLDVYDYNSGK
jgi:hypothetical protein